VTDEDLVVTNDPSHVTDSNPPNYAQRDGVTDVTDKSLGGDGYARAYGSNATYPQMRHLSVDQR
jgi:hypothetical protein